MLWSPPWSR